MPTFTETEALGESDISVGMNFKDKIGSQHESRRGKAYDVKDVVINNNDVKGEGEHKRDSRTYCNAIGRTIAIPRSYSSVTSPRHKIDSVERENGRAGPPSPFQNEISNASDTSVIESEEFTMMYQSSEEMISDSVDKFVSCIMPNNDSNMKRQNIIAFLSNVIKAAFPAKCAITVIPFGSVPLRAYLPTGDIDIGIFCRGSQLSASWTYILQNALRDAGKFVDRKKSGHKITGIHVIDAEVRVCKCFVDEIEVDISSNMPGGVSTLGFLERVSNRICAS